MKAFFLNPVGVATALLVACLLPASLLADKIFMDDFSAYPGGAELAGQGSATNGWTGAWARPDASDTFHVAPQSLTYPGGVPAPSSGSIISASNKSAPAVNYRDFDNPIDLETETVYYLTMLVNRDAMSDIQFSLSDPSSENSEVIFYIGVDGRMTISNWTNSVETLPDPIPAGVDVLLVIEIKASPFQSVLSVTFLAQAASYPYDPPQSWMGSWGATLRTRFSRLAVKSTIGTARADEFYCVTNWSDGLGGLVPRKTPIVNEPFADYAIGSLVGQEGGGSGWEDPDWTTSLTHSDPSNDMYAAFVIDQTLNFPSSGGPIPGKGHSIYLPPPSVYITLVREAESVVDLAADKTYFFSFLYQSNDNGGHSSVAIVEPGAYLHPVAGKAAAPTIPKGVDGFGMSIAKNPSNTVLVLMAGANTLSIPLNQPLNSDTYYFVLRVQCFADPSKPDQVWVIPYGPGTDLPETEPADDKWLGPVAFTMNQMVDVFSLSTTSGGANLDELLLTDQWSLLFYNRPGHGDSLISYEGFEYDDGDRLSGKSGGSGWQGAWSAPNSATIVGAGMNYPGGVPGKGGALNLNTGGGGVPVAIRNSSHTVSKSHPGSIYWSFLVNAKTGSNFTAAMWPQSKLEISGSTVKLNDQTVDGFKMDVDQLVVFKMTIDASGNATVAVKFYDTTAPITDEEPTSDDGWNAVVRYQPDSTTYTIMTLSDVTGNTTLDEVRVSDSWDAVVHNPSPE